MRAPTGEQHVLSRSTGSRQSRAIITELAASLREFTIDGVAITEPYAESETPPFGCGIALAPWPNRVRDGRWRYEGAWQQLGLSEPELGNALHGLLRFTPYTVLEREQHAITLAATVFPQLGYPFLLDTTVRYELEESGLRVTHGVTNRSSVAAPVAFGAHPYFRIGEVAVDDLVVTIEATNYIEVDARLNPIAQPATAGTPFELSHGVRVGELGHGATFDAALGGLVARDGRIRHRLEAPDGRALEIWQQADWEFVQVFVTREFPRQGGLATAIAIEPMTAAPDALNSGLGLRWLAPGESWNTSWGVNYVH